MSGYTPCACRDCMEIAFDDGMCSECEEAGCTGDGECDAPHAYDAADNCTDDYEAEAVAAGFLPMPAGDIDAVLAVLLATDFVLDLT